MRLKREIWNFYNFWLEQLNRLYSMQQSISSWLLVLRVISLLFSIWFRWTNRSWNLKYWNLNYRNLLHVQSCVSTKQNLSCHVYHKLPQWLSNWFSKSWYCMCSMARQGYFYFRTGQFFLSLSQSQDMTSHH